MKFRIKPVRSRASGEITFIGIHPDGGKFFGNITARPCQEDPFQQSLEPYFEDTRVRTPPRDTIAEVFADISALLEELE